MTAPAADPSLLAAPGQDLAGVSLWQDAWRRLRRNRMAMAGGAVTMLLTAAAFVGPLVIGATWGYDYEA